MAKHHLVCEAKKKHRRNRQKNWEKIRAGIVAELERKANAKRLKKAQKAVESARKKAIENAEKDRVRLAKKKTQTNKTTKKSEVKKVTKRTTKNGNTK